jgi:hypothetical protein
VTATVEADVILVTAPEVRKGRRVADPPDSPEREFAYVTARGADGTRWEMFGITATAMAAIGKLGKGDAASVRGEFAVKAVAGCAVVMINVTSIALHLPGFPKPKAPKPCSTSTRGLTYHVVPGRYTAEDIGSKIDQMAVNGELMLAAQSGVLPAGKISRPYLNIDRAPYVNRHSLRCPRLYGRRKGRPQ